MSLMNAVSEVQKNLEAMREVTVIMHYAIDGYPAMINSNKLCLPARTDTIDPKSLDTMRHVWLDALARPQIEFHPSALKPKRDKTLEDILADALKSVTEDAEVQASFVKASRLPVPSEYAVMLPLVGPAMRKEILTCLVPFQETRAMLLRLEDTLELPMRCLEIGHTPVNSVTELQASIRFTADKKLTIH